MSAGQGLPAGSPVGKPVRQLGKVAWVIAVRQQGTDGMADPDDPVRSGGHHARQQPRPPGIEHLPPRPLAELRAEERGPVGDPAQVAKRLLPVGPDRAQPTRELLQAAHVPIEPGTHQVAMAVTDHRLGCHRPVVGQKTVELWPGRVQPLVGLVQRSRAS